MKEGERHGWHGWQGCLEQQPKKKGGGGGENIKSRKNKRRGGKRYLDTFVRCASRASRQLRLRWPGCALSRMIHLPGFERVGRRRGRQFHSRCTQSETRQNFITTTTTTPMHRHTGSKIHITVTQPYIYIYIDICVCVCVLVRAIVRTD